MLDALLKAKFAESRDEREQKEKTSFWASDVEKNPFEIYHKWIGTEPTNPPDFNTHLMFGCGKGAEIELAKWMSRFGVLVEPEDGEHQHRIDIERLGVPISGKMDAVVPKEIFKLGNDVPVEVKTFYGHYQRTSLVNGEPKMNYLKQLAVYMDALDAPLGILFMISRETGETFEFHLHKRKDYPTEFYMDNGISFDIEDEYREWSLLYENHILPQVEPRSKFKYKYPIDTIDWSVVSKSDISKARNGQKVIGDWQVLYSDYKELIIQQEGTELGYTLEEIEQIKAATKGYSSKK